MVLAGSMGRGLGVTRGVEWMDDCAEWYDSPLDMQHWLANAPVRRKQPTYSTCPHIRLLCASLTFIAVIIIQYQPLAWGRGREAGWRGAEGWGNEGIPIPPPRDVKFA